MDKDLEKTVERLVKRIAFLEDKLYSLWGEHYSSDTMEDWIEY